ncbi:MAG: hypothetical protein ACFE8V_07415 [Promethearchaeota archaeon]
MEREVLKKIKLNLNLGIIGKDDSGKEFLIEYLIQIALNHNESGILHEFLTVFQDVPIKFRVYTVKDFNQILIEYESIKRVDILIMVIDIFKLDSLIDINFKDIEEFNSTYMFKGISILVGIDKYSIEHLDVLHQERINRFDFIQKSKDLGFLYCFEVKTRNQDISELFNIAINNYILKLRNTNPDLLKKAKSYGKELKNQLNF